MFKVFKGDCANRRSSFKCAIYATICLGIILLFRQMSLKTEILVILLLNPISARKGT